MTAKPDVIYSKDNAVFQNRIKDLYKGMSLDEKRLLVLLSPIVRTTKTKEGQAAFLSADEYARECGISHSRAYDALSNASEKLVRRYFSYTSDDGRKTVANWILRSTYDEGGVDVFFTSEVLEMLQVFDKINPYTKYKKEIVLRLKGDYAFEIYHIAKQNEGLGKIDVNLEDLRENLAVPNSYGNLSNFKKRVLESSCQEISQNTDITLSYETVKRGRTVVAIRFIIKKKNEKKPRLAEMKGRDKNTIDMFCNLTDAQINKYSTILCKVPELSNLSTFQDYPSFALWIGGILRDPKSVREETAKRIFKALHQKTDFKSIN